MAQFQMVLKVMKLSNKLLRWLTRAQFRMVLKVTDYISKKQKQIFILS